MKLRARAKSMAVFVCGAFRQLQKTKSTCDFRTVVCICFVSSFIAHHIVFLRILFSNETFVLSLSRCRACAISPGEIPAQSCFNDHPLEYVSDPLHSAPKDVNYPERAYIPNSSTRPWNYQHRYKLPSGVSGDNVLIQWKYITANSCNPPGYDNYPFPSGFLPGNVATCGALVSSRSRPLAYDLFA